MQKTTIIGGGNMAEALLRGLLDAGFSPSDFIVTDPSRARRKYLAEAFSVAAIEDNVEAVREADIVILAVKPGVIAHVLNGIRETVARTAPLIVSIAAGVPIGTILGATGDAARVVRVMPNTPALVGEAMSVLCRGGKATDADLETAREIFSKIGRTEVVEERLMDAVTGLSGSGPAYVFLMIEALADGGVLNGIPRDQSLALSRQTVLGAARLAVSSEDHPGVLKDRVASPGGTTIEGLAALERAGFRNAIIEAVTAATRRSEELGGR